MLPHRVIVLFALLLSILRFVFYRSQPQSGLPFGLPLDYHWTIAMDFAPWIPPTRMFLDTPLPGMDYPVVIQDSRFHGL